MMSQPPLPTYFLSHGGGPWPWMKDDMPGVFDELEDSLKMIPKELGATPRAVLVVTAHWIERGFIVSGHKTPPMIYDFGGFPPHTYHVKYPAPGLPELALEVEARLKEAGFITRVDLERGFDHGTYTPLVPMYPQADIPVVQLSIDRRFDPETHLKVGQALAGFRQKGVLILGSGLSFHNLSTFGPQALAPSRAFDRWLQETMVMPPQERWDRLCRWSTAPSARQAHPREDHLLPLMVAVGAAWDEKARVVYHQDSFMGGWCVSSFRFGEIPSPKS
jgi:aromatic ring-opening dioxygenase catalytic subunit (LigB family)